MKRTTFFGHIIQFSTRKTITKIISLLLTNLQVNLWRVNRSWIENTLFLPCSYNVNGKVLPSFPLSSTVYALHQLPGNKHVLKSEISRIDHARYYVNDVQYAKCVFGNVHLALVQFVSSFALRLLTVESYIF